jgi:hypothetical protein
MATPSRLRGGPMEIAADGGKLRKSRVRFV